MLWNDPIFKSSDDLEELLEQHKETGEDFRDVDEAGGAYSQVYVFGSETDTLNCTVILFAHYEEGSTNPSSGVGFIQHRIEELEYIVEGELEVLYGDDSGDEVVEQYTATEGDFFGHQALTPHKLVVTEAPLIGLAFYPTGTELENRTIGSHTIDDDLL